MMFRTDIYKTEQLDLQHEYKNFFGFERRISITLYDKIIDKKNASQLAERILLLFTDERGAYKRTYAQRFDKFDAVVLNFLHDNFSATQKIILHDAGVSDARTAADFFKKLSNEFVVEYHASDYNQEVFVIETCKMKVTLSQNQKAIEVVCPPFVFNLIRPERIWRAPVNRLIQFFIERFIVPNIIRKFQDGELKSKNIFLYAPGALQLSKDNSNFKLLTYDILQPLKMKNNVIRAMNLLNSSYFTDAEFKIIVDNIFHGLDENGIFIVGSNGDPGSVVDGAIYKKEGHEFTRLWQSGSGAYIDKFIQQHNFNIRKTS